MNRDKMTVVFSVKDRNALEAIYEAHRTGGLICGMSPEILSWGDKITIPDEIIEGLKEIDPDSPNKKELKELVELAEIAEKY